MSSDQFSDEPLPPPEKRCSQCGQVTTSTGEMCWLCLERFSVQEGVDPIRHSLIDDPSSKKVDDTRGTLAFFGFIGVLFTIVMATQFPGVLIIIAALTVPVLIRTVLAAKREDAPGWKSGVAIFLSSLGVMFFVGMVSMGAFFVVCVGAGFAAAGFSNSLEGSIYFGIVAGSVVGLLVAGGLLYHVWWRKD